MALNYSELKEVGEFSVLKEGTYDFKIIDCEATVSKNTGNEMLKLTLKEVKSSNTIFTYAANSNMVLALCKAAKIPADAPISVDDLNIIAKLVKNRTITTAVKIEQYNGKDQNKAGWLNPCKTFDATEFNDEIENIILNVFTGNTDDTSSVPF